MIVDHDPRRDPAPYPGPYAGDPRHRSALRRFLGGSPGTVFVKLLFLSVLVGAILAMIGLSPRDLFQFAYEGVRALADLGLDTFQDLGAWLLAGAVVVVPLWLIARLFAVAK